MMPLEFLLIHRENDGRLGVALRYDPHYDTLIIVGKWHYMPAQDLIDAGVQIAVSTGYRRNGGEWIAVTQEH